MLVDDDRRHAEALQARAKRNAALAAADDQAIGLTAERRVRPPRAPCARAQVLRPLHDAVLHALLARRAALFLKSLQFGHRGQQRPAFFAFEANIALAAADRRFECEPAFGDPFLFARLILDRPMRRLHIRKARAQHLRDRRPAFKRLDVPGEGDEIAPKAILVEQVYDGVDVRGAQRLIEFFQPARNALGRHHCLPSTCPPAARSDVSPESLSPMRLTEFARRIRRDASRVCGRSDRALNHSIDQQN